MRACTQTAAATVNVDDDHDGEMRGRASGAATNRLHRDDARAAAWDILASRGCVRSVTTDDDDKNDFEDDDALFYDNNDIFYVDDDDIFRDNDNAFVPWGASSFQHAAIGLPASSYVMQCCASWH